MHEDYAPASKDDCTATQKTHPMHIMHTTKSQKEECGVPCSGEYTVPVETAPNCAPAFCDGVRSSGIEKADDGREKASTSI